MEGPGAQVILDPGQQGVVQARAVALGAQPTHERVIPRQGRQPMEAGGAPRQVLFDFSGLCLGQQAQAELLEPFDAGASGWDRHESPLPFSP
jgi:hypothetical protein